MDADRDAAVRTLWLIDNHRYGAVLQTFFNTLGVHDDPEAKDEALARYIEARIAAGQVVMSEMAEKGEGYVG